MRTIPNEAEFMKAFRKKDATAIKSFFDAESRAAIKWLEKHYWRIPEVDKEDLIADAFVKVYDGAERYNSYHHAYSSLMLILSHNVVDYFRARKRTFIINEGYIFHCEETVDSTQDEVDQLAIIKEAIKRLPPKRRHIIELSLYEGKNIKEIAEVTGRRKQTVLNERSRAIDFLRKIIPNVGKEKGKMMHFDSQKYDTFSYG